MRDQYTSNVSDVLKSPSSGRWLGPIEPSALHDITRRARKDGISNGGTSWPGSGLNARLYAGLSSCRSAVSRH